MIGIRIQRLARPRQRGIILPQQIVAERVGRRKLISGVGVAALGSHREQLDGLPMLAAHEVAHAENAAGPHVSRVLSAAIAADRLVVISSCIANRSPMSRSYRPFHNCSPLSGAISSAVTRILVPARRTEPWIRYVASISRAMRRVLTFLPLNENVEFLLSTRKNDCSESACIRSSGSPSEKYSAVLSLRFAKGSTP